MRAPRLTELLAVILCLAVLAAILFPVFAQSKTGHKPSCFRHLKMQGLALLFYAGDADDRLPQRDRWMDATDSYLKNEWARHCPEALPKGVYGYAFNGGLSGRPLGALVEVATTPLAYDSVNPIRNASDLVASLPSPGRHHGSDNLTYADGHARGVRMPGTQSVP